jgi:DNA-binding NarL/FixJ family response regulator
MALALGQCGIEVHLVDEGDELIASAAQLRPQLLLVSDLLDDGEVLDLASRLRRAPKVDARVILVMADEESCDMDALRAEGVAAFLPKPFTPASLVQAVAAVMGEEYTDPNSDLRENPDSYQVISTSRDDNEALLPEPPSVEEALSSSAAHASSDGDHQVLDAAGLPVDASVLSSLSGEEMMEAVAEARRRAGYPQTDPSLPRVEDAPLATPITEDDMTPLPSQALDLLRQQVDDADERLAGLSEDDFSVPDTGAGGRMVELDTGAGEDDTVVSIQGDRKARRAAPWFDDLITASVDRHLNELLRPGGTLHRSIEQAVRRAVADALGSDKSAD